MTDGRFDALARQQADHARAEAAHLMENSPAQPRWKAYGLTVSYPMTDEAISNVVQIGMDEAKAGAQRELERMVFAEPQPYVPPSRLARLRSWLGWKLWRLATWLEPDVCD